MTTATAAVDLQLQDVGDHHDRGFVLHSRHTEEIAEVECRTNKKLSISYRMRIPTATRFGDDEEKLRKEVESWMAGTDLPFATWGAVCGYGDEATQKLSERLTTAIRPTMLSFEGRACRKAQLGILLPEALVREWAPVFEKFNLNLSELEKRATKVELRLKDLGLEQTGARDAVRRVLWNFMRSPDTVTAEGPREDLDGEIGMRVYRRIEAPGLKPTCGEIPIPYAALILDTFAHCAFPSSQTVFLHARALLSGLSSPEKPLAAADLGGREFLQIARVCMAVHDAGPLQTVTLKSAHVATSTRGQIDSPREQTAGSVIQARGTIRELPSGGRLWLAVKKGDRIWPKEPSPAVRGTSWSATISEGTPPGGAFELVLYLVRGQGTKQIQDWFEAGRLSGDFPGIQNLKESVPLHTVPLRMGPAH